MKRIFDITKEVFSADVYPGDPVPVVETVLSLEKEEPDLCQLSKITLGSHTGTHMDAPKHFILGGKSIDEICLEQCVGKCKVAAMHGNVDGAALQKVLEDSPKRLLIKGDIILMPDAAEQLVRKHVQCIGVEGMTVGSESDLETVHKILLNAETVILEALDLSEITEGNYFLTALPLKLGGLDGSPVRAILLKEE